MSCDLNIQLFLSRHLNSDFIFWVKIREITLPWMERNKAYVHVSWGHDVLTPELPIIYQRLLISSLLLTVSPWWLHCDLFLIMQSSTQRRTMKTSATSLSLSLTKCHMQTYAGLQVFFPSEKIYKGFFWTVASHWSFNLQPVFYAWASASSSIQGCLMQSLDCPIEHIAYLICQGTDAETFWYCSETAESSVPGRSSH